MSPAKRKALGLLTFLVLTTGVARGADVEVRLHVESRTVYDLEGSFRVEASTAVVWDVLTDYDHIADFVPSMRSSRAAERRPDGVAVVEQEALGGAWFFSRRVRVRLEVRRSGDALAFRDLGRSDFRNYEGSWEVRPAGGEREVVYRLQARPGFAAPAFLVRRGFRRGAADLLRRVRAEILRRGGVSRQNTK